MGGLGGGYLGCMAGAVGLKNLGLQCRWVARHWGRLSKAHWGRLSKAQARAMNSQRGRPVSAS